MKTQTPTTFAERLYLLCGTDVIAEIARKTDTAHNTVKNYVQGREPGVPFLKTLVEKTGVNLNWLLMARGAMYETAETVTTVGSSQEVETIEVVIPRGAKVVLTVAEPLQPAEGSDASKIAPETIPIFETDDDSPKDTARATPTRKGARHAAASPTAVVKG